MTKSSNEDVGVTGAVTSPAAVGSVVTYRYRDLTSSGLPRFASFLRVHDAL